MISYADDPGAFRHQAILVQHGKMSAWIDIQIARFVKSLWETGIRTELSCEETDPGIAFVAFTPGGHCERFCRRLIGADVDWRIFDQLDQAKDVASFMRDFERGYFPFNNIPVWSKANRDDLLFPLAYLSKFEEIAARPDLETQGPRTIFMINSR